MSEEPTSLPEVASNFYYDCKKCGEQRYHKVLTHPTSTSAKLECEVCGSKKTYKLGAKKKAKRGRRKSPAKTLESTWNEWREKSNTEEPISYTMKKNFNELNEIDHPKFGVGVVSSVMGSKINVVFVDGERLLVHNRE